MSARRAKIIFCPPANALEGDNGSQWRGQCGRTAAGRPAARSAASSGSPIVSTERATARPPGARAQVNGAGAGGRSSSPSINRLSLIPRRECAAAPLQFAFRRLCAGHTCCAHRRRPGQTDADRARLEPPNLLAPLSGRREVSRRVLIGPRRRRMQIKAAESH